MIPENTPRLETTDLILRRFTENDLHAVLVYAEYKKNSPEWFIEKI